LFHFISIPFEKGFDRERYGFREQLNKIMRARQDYPFPEKLKIQRRAGRWKRRCPALVETKCGRKNEMAGAGNVFRRERRIAGSKPSLNAERGVRFRSFRLLP
jgi:hypothetical protein